MAPLHPTPLFLPWYIVRFPLDLELLSFTLLFFCTSPFSCLPLPRSDRRGRGLLMFLWTPLPPPFLLSESTSPYYPFSLQP